MARIYPQDTPFSGTKSPAERRLYYAFKKLPDEYIVIHSLNVGSLRYDGFLERSEVDFLIINPQRGILLLEVKGGIISVCHETREWFSTNMKGQKFVIHDPFVQVLSNERRIWEKLRDISDLKRKWIISAVDFADTLWERQQIVAFDDRLILDRESEINFKGAIERLFETRRLDWQPSKLNSSLITTIVKRFLPSFQPLTYQKRIRLSNLLMKQMTQQQGLTFATIVENQPQCIVEGGAGTGKSFLALTLASQQAAQGKRVLLLCWNDYQADWFNSMIAQEHLCEDTLHVFPLTTFCETMVAQAGIKPPQLQEALIEATEGQKKLVNMLTNSIKRLYTGHQAKAGEWRYDAIIIDEGQDIEAPFINTARSLLRDPQNGCFCILGDPYQRIDFETAWDVNPPLTVLPLTRNIRNAPKIQKLMAKFRPEMLLTPNNDSYDDGVTAFSSLPKGDEEEVDLATQTKLHDLLYGLVKEQGIEPSDILIITGRPESRSKWKTWKQEWKNIPIEHLRTITSRQEDRGRFIALSTIRAAKGLESEVVVLVELDGIDINTPVAGRKVSPMQHDKLLYIALSRAKYALYVIGSSESIAPHRA